MKVVLKIAFPLMSCLFFGFIQPAIAQPPNDECINAIDISEAFMGNCGELTFNGPFDLTGSTPGDNDPPEPSAFSCPGDEPDDPNLFGDDADYWENSVWFTWTVPDLNGDGSPVSYAIWTSDGSFNDDCGLFFDFILTGNADTQAAIYEGACPTSITGGCDHFAANEDLFTMPPWVAGWLTLEFTPGVPYYMGVDGWNAVTGSFCITVVTCGIACGDDKCAVLEDYCSCTDCRADEDGNTTCTFGNIAPIGYQENDLTTPGDESGYFFADDLQSNIFFCSDWVNGYKGENVYLAFGAFAWTDCANNSFDSISLTLNVGRFISNASENNDETINIPTGSLLFIELTPTEIALGSITISSAVPDGLGNICDEILTINFADFPQATNPYCELTCFAGGIDTDLLTYGLTICENETFSLKTDGLEDLTLPCSSNDGSSYEYAWRVLVDIYGTDEYNAVTSWQPLGPFPTGIEPATFFIDEFGYTMPYYSWFSFIFF